MTEKTLAKAEKETGEAIEWVAATFSYIEEARKDMADAKKHLQNAKRDTAKARQALDYSGKAEARAERYEHQLEKDLNTLEKELDEDLAKKVKKVHTDLEIEEDTVLKSASRYEGELKKRINELKKLLDDYEDGKVEESAIQSHISDTLIYIGKCEKWISALLASLRELKDIEAEAEARE